MTPSHSPFRSRTHARTRTHSCVSPLRVCQCMRCVRACHRCVFQAVYTMRSCVSPLRISGSVYDAFVRITVAYFRQCIRCVRACHRCVFQAVYTVRSCVSPFYVSGSVRNVRVIVACLSQCTQRDVRVTVACLSVCGAVSDSDWRRE